MSNAKATRKSVQAIVEESSEGTPLDPSSGSDFMTMQEGFDVSPSFATIDNVELSPSVDSKAPIIGEEGPSSTIGHYYRHSGVEATRPNYSPLLKALLGSTEDAPSESDTSGGSTSGDADSRAVIKLQSGGSNFERGSAFLLKDSSNGYVIRNVYSVSGNDLTCLFNLNQAAPASGVGTGRPILYKTSDEPPALSHHVYRGNGAAHEVLTGVKIESGTLTAQAGQPLNWEFSLKGTGYYFNPIRIDAADRYLDFDLGGSEISVAVNAGLYKDPHDLAASLQQAMEDSGASGTFSVEYNDIGDDAGKFSIEHSGGTLNLLFSSGSNTANSIADAIGWTTDADVTGDSVYTSSSAQNWAAPYSETSDSDTNPLIMKNNEVLLGTFNRVACSETQEFTLSIENEYQDVKDACAETAISEKLLTRRNTTVAIVMTLKQHDAKSFYHFRQGDIIQFAYNGGTKVGGNWVAGKCVNVAIIEARISEWKVSDTNGIVTISATLQAVGNSSGYQNVFLNLL